MTDNFIVLYIRPVHFKGMDASLLWHRNTVGAMADLDPDARPSGEWPTVAMIVVLSEIESPAFLCFHTTNAWEEPSKHNENEVDVDIWEAAHGHPPSPLLPEPGVSPAPA
ncbi:hypothetical protein DOTSEDRAFT_71697 [Dothistroma septosporum NZE10]|uniref:Uncharacterized protein n=1 Tax=Dothistroma septosporum (strain NZE10 / CBS 128990) TaxID=675120 RepID=N1PLS3_DOTSN|nr:hypothetical protein DOTSEDRAFT_71697 [Dothistroma septosporum NZE10]